MTDTINERIAKAKDWTVTGSLTWPTQFHDENGRSWGRLVDYEDDISAAWKLVEEMSNAKFSKRDRFTKALTEAISQRYRPAGASWSLDWPDAFLRVTPQDIAIAWLAVNEDKAAEAGAESNG